MADRPAILRRLGRSRVVAVAAIVILVWLGVLGARSIAALESFELMAYDGFIRLQPGTPGPDPRVLMITCTEDDIRANGGWPLSDAVLARALQTLASYGPRAIGLDIYRDVRVPPGTAQLEEVFRRYERIIAVMQLGRAASIAVPPPPALLGSDRVGFSNLLVDSGGVVRRGLLFADDGKTVMSSFALRAALAYLKSAGVTPRPDPADPRQLRLGGTTIPPLQPNYGPYVGADARGYQMLLDFKGGRGAFRALPLEALLSGTITPDLVGDKVVLLGVAAESVGDHFYTPFSRGLREAQHVPGLAVHAYIVSQLLRFGLDGDAPLSVASASETAVWVLFWGAAGGVLGLLVRSPWGFLAAATGGLAAVGVIDFLAFRRGWWLPLVPPAVSWVASAILVTAYVSYREAVERGMLMQLFSRHVSDEIAEAIWKARDQFLDGRRPRPQGLVATVMFTDLTDFVHVAERLPPEELMEWLNEYMDAMAQQVTLHRGVIRQYAGDSIVVVFGVPVPRLRESEIAEDAVNAVSCALAMEAALGALNARWRVDDRPRVGMRIGIFTGPVVAGSLGSAKRSEYVVVGDAVNTASRLESVGRELFPPDPERAPCRILIGESTLRYLDARFATERVGEGVTVKGKAHPIEIYRVIGRRRPGAVITAPDAPG